MDKVKLEGIYAATFGKEDKHGEMFATIEVVLPRPHHNTQVYLDLSINGGPAEEYHFIYNDAGTVMYARMGGNFAINGRLTNVSENSHKKPFFIINAIGSMKVETLSRITLWGKANNLLKNQIIK